MKAPELKPVASETTAVAEKEVAKDVEEVEEDSESKMIEEAAVIAVATQKKPKAKKSKKTEPVQHVYQARPEEVKKEVVADVEARNDLIAEEREEIASMEREKASYRTEEKEFGKVDKSEVKEAVVINYNSTIVATNPESNKVLNYIDSEKSKMIEQLSELESQYEEAIPKYSSVSDSLSAEKQRIAQVIDKAENMEETGWSNIIEYKNSVLHFKRRFRELVVENNKNTMASRNRGPGSIEIIEEESAEVAQADVQVEEEPDQKASVKEELAVDQVSVTAMKKNGNGKYQVTSNANKTDLIKVTFKLKSQKKGEIGRKEAHLVMQNPKGSVAEAKGIFTIKDSQTESKYTDHAIINYNNHDVDVTMFVQRKGNQFEKGVYPIKLFVEGELMAVSNLDLQNAN